MSLPRDWDISLSIIICRDGLDKCLVGQVQQSDVLWKFHYTGFHITGNSSTLKPRFHIVCPKAAIQSPLKRKSTWHQVCKKHLLMPEDLFLQYWLWHSDWMTEIVNRWWDMQHHTHTANAILYNATQELPTPTILVSMNLECNSWSHCAQAVSGQEVKQPLVSMGNHQVLCRSPAMHRKRHCLNLDGHA